MATRTLRTALAAALLAAATAAPGAARAQEAGEGQRAVPVEVRSTLDHPPTVEACRRAIADALPAYAAVWPAPPAPEARLVLRLAATHGEFADIVTRAGAPWLAPFLAATLDAGNESVVAVQPRVDRASLDGARGLPSLLRHLVVHEGAHQYARVLGVPNADRWPAWYAEGVADWIARRALDAARPEGGGVPVSVDDERWRVAEAVRAGRSIPLERLLHAQAFAHDDVRRLYAHASTFVDSLSSDPGSFRALHAAVAALPAGRGPWDASVREVEEACARVLAETCGPVDALERRWHERVLGAKPRWFEPWRSVEEIAAGRYLCSAFADESALAVRAEPPPAGGYLLRGRLELPEDSQANLAVAVEGLSPVRFLQVGLRRDGSVVLHVRADGHWQTRYRVDGVLPPEALAGTDPVPFRLTVTARSLVLALHGEDVAEFDVPPGFDPEGGRWGIGAHDGTAVFSDLAVEALPR